MARGVVNRHTPGGKDVCARTYDLKALKVKRRGMLPALKTPTEEPTKILVTIALDRDVVEYYKQAATKRGALPYQTQINQALRQSMAQPAVQALKSELLKDKDFIRSLAREAGLG